MDDLEGLGEDSDEDEFQEVKQPPRGGDDEMAVDGAVGVKPEDVGANGEGKRKKEEDDEEVRYVSFGCCGGGNGEASSATHVTDVCVCVCHHRVQRA